MPKIRKPIVSIASILLLMSLRRVIHLIFTLTLMLFVGIFEVISIGAILPVLTALNGSDELLTLPLPLLQSSMNEVPLTIELAATILIIASLVTAALRILLSWVSIRFITGLGHDIDLKIFKNFLSLKYENYITQNSSELIAAIEKVQVVIFGVMHPLFQGFVSFVIGLFIILFLINLDANAIGVALGIVCILYLSISFSVSQTLKRNSVLLAKSQTERIRNIKEAYGSFRDIIISKNHTFFFNKFRSHDFRYRNSQGINAFLQASPRIVVEGATMSLLAAFALYSITRGSDYSNAIPILGAMAVGAQRLLPLMQQVYYGWSSIQGASELLMEVDEFCQETDLPFSNDLYPSKMNVFNKEIIFRDVSYRYPETNELVINKANFTLSKGEMIGIIGDSGSGKSTLIDLLMGLLKPTNGEIQIDQMILTVQNMDQWHWEIAHVPQNIFLTDDTIAANIAFGNNVYKSNKIEKAINSAQIRDFIVRLQKGIDTKIGEGGVTLSGGQRQRIGVARALYNEANVIIFDEATNALDTKTEGKLLKEINKLDTSTTIIMVSHNHENLKYCDKILKVSSGTVTLLSGNTLI